MCVFQFLAIAASGNKASWLTNIALISSNNRLVRKFESHSILLKADDRCVFLEIDILVSAEVFCERYAGEVTAPVAVVDRGEVEDEDEHQEDEEGDAEAEDHEYCSSGLRG